MCQKRNSRLIPYGNQSNCSAKIDECLYRSVVRLNKLGKPTLSSCCGHGRYKKSIIILCKDGVTRKEFYSNKIIPRQRRFYIMDEEGYYFIPEIEK